MKSKITSELKRHGIEYRVESFGIFAKSEFYKCGVGFTFDWVEITSIKMMYEWLGY